MARGFRGWGCGLTGAVPDRAGAGCGRVWLGGDGFAESRREGPDLTVVAGGQGHEFGRGWRDGGGLAASCSSVMFGRFEHDQVVWIVTLGEGGAVAGVGRGARPAGLVGCARWCGGIGTARRGTCRRGLAGRVKPDAWDIAGGPCDGRVMNIDMG